MKKLNKKGFTLVELLAVIVVLAVIMIIAVPSVLDSMNSARKSAFIVYGDKMINAAQAKYQSDQLAGLGLKEEICYPLSTLTDSDTGNMYTGYVIVTYYDHADKTDDATRSEKALYYITMTDKNFSVENKSYAELDGIKNGTLKNEDEEVITLDDPVTPYVEGDNATVCPGYTKVTDRNWYKKTETPSS